MSESRKLRILFVATREPSYSRVAITLSALKANFDVREIVCDDSRYWLRLAKILCRFLICRKSRYDILFAGFFAQPLFPVFRLFWRGTIVSDAYFSFYDTLVNDKKRAKPNSMVGKYVRWLDRYMLKNSDLSFTDTLEHAKYMKRDLQVPNANLKRLWISAKESEFQELPEIDFRKESGDPFRVLFWGGFIPLQGVETIIEAAARLKNDNVDFDICGTGQTYADCLELNERLGASNVRFHGWTEPPRIRELARESHLVLGIFGSTDKAKRVIPNKAYEALCLARPLLTGDSAAIRELLTDQKDGILCEMANSEDLAAKIKECKQDYAATKAIALKGKATFEANASEAFIAEILKRELTKLRSEKN